MTDRQITSLRLQVRHTTHYSFEEPVRYGLQKLRKTARSTPLQNVVHWTTALEGATPALAYSDHHGNRVELIAIDADTRAMSVTCTGEVEVQDTAGVVGRHRGPAPLWLYLAETELTQAKSGVKALTRGVRGSDMLGTLHALSAAILDAVPYTLGASEATWSAEEALAQAQGVCQDHTHIFLAATRAMEIPARYVSGYLMLNDRVTQEAMHAWAEAYVEGLGWVGFDVSNGQSPDARYIRVATGRDYREAAPVVGSRVGGQGESLAVEIEVAQQ